MQRMYVDAYENTEESLIATCTNNQLHVQNETFKSTIQQLLHKYVKKLAVIILKEEIKML